MKLMEKKEEHFGVVEDHSGCVVSLDWRSLTPILVSGVDRRNDQGRNSTFFFEVGE